MRCFRKQTIGEVFLLSKSPGIMFDNFFPVYKLREIDHTRFASSEVSTGMIHANQSKAFCKLNANYSENQLKLFFLLISVWDANEDALSSRFDIFV